MNETVSRPAVVTARRVGHPRLRQGLAQGLTYLGLALALVFFSGPSSGS